MLQILFTVIANGGNSALHQLTDTARVFVYDYQENDEIERGLKERNIYRASWREKYSMNSAREKQFLIGIFLFENF